MEKTFAYFAMILALCVLMIMPACSGKAGAQNLPEANGPDQDRTLSPYFFVRSDDPDTDRLPLKRTHADIKIAGVMADVTITQVYKNEGKNTLEAIYVFPASTRAAVYAMRMTIGERVIEAEIKEREEARKTYEHAKQEGRTTSLLEQQRPNVFQMNVANILPGDVIQVELEYIELIEPDDKVYEFVFPTVVGPRYSTTPAGEAPDTEKWVENPYLHSGEPAPYSFGLSLDIQTGIPISQLTSPSHDISVEYSGQARAHVTLKEDDQAGTKDFVLRYKLAGGKIQAGLLLYPGRDENFFLLMMEPPARVKAHAVVPREYIFIVDVSGSMNGFPINVAKALMKDIIMGLRPDDLMNVLLFAGGSAVLSEGKSLPATEANKNKAVSWINSQHGGGGTNILPALKHALDLPRTEGVSRIVVVVTDGYVSVEPQTFELIRKNLGQANLFAFGIGSSVNRHLIEGMARVGRGEPFVVLNRGEARKKAATFRRYIESPVLTDITIAFEGLNAYDVEPLAVPDLFALRSVVVFGKYRGEPRGEVMVRGRTTLGDFKRVMRVTGDMASPENSALRLLWARHRIMRLSDLNRLREDDERAKAVTALGLKYSLMTQYTSFVAVDKVRRADGQIVTVKQPLPLPAGVSDLAVGDRSVGAAKSSMRFKAVAPATEQMVMAAPLKDSVSREVEEVSKKGSIDITVEQITGGLDKRLIEKALRAKLEAMTSCYLNALRRQPQAQGKIVYRLLISPDGKVSQVYLVASTLGNPSAIECIKKKIQAIKFSHARHAAGEIIIKLVCRPER